MGSIGDPVSRLHLADAVVATNSVKAIREYFNRLRPNLLEANRKNWPVRAFLGRYYKIVATVDKLKQKLFSFLM